MKITKKGFTLAEVLIVVAIIVIISGAAIAGIAVSVADANDRGEKIKQLHGEGNWEAEAHQEIKDGVPPLGDEQIYEESLDTPAPTSAAENTDSLSGGSDEGDESTGGGSGTDSGSGTGTGGGGTGTESGSSTGTGTGTSTGTGTGTSTGTGTGTGTSTGSGAGTAATVSTSTSSGTRWNPNVGQWGSNTPTTTSNVTVSSQGNSQITKCTVTVEEGDVYSWSFNNWKYDCNKIDENTFEISYKLTGDNATYNPPDTTLNGLTITYDSGTEGKVSASVG
jgi:prepilin-type N-terminal cleavage/methylation domain-containing protein